MDAAFARASVFVKLRKKANVTHVVFDYNLPSQCTDEEIYKLAIQENRFVVTINYQDFKKLVQKGKPGIIIVPSELFNEEIDTVLHEFVLGKSPDDYMGKAIKV